MASINMNAAEEIARQLRLRDMGGIIIIDFIDMDSNENKIKLFKHMQSLMQNDRAKHNILPITKFGLMQITRQRVRPAMEINTSESCPSCNGTGKISSSLLIDETIERELAYFVKEDGIVYHKPSTTWVALQPIVALVMDSNIKVRETGHVFAVDGV